MRRGLVALAAGILVSAATGAAAAPADDAAARAIVDALGSAATATGSCPAVAIGVDRAGKTSEQFYGTSGTRRPLDGKTLFEVDSLTKTFTSLILALAVQRPDHPISLDDPLQKYAPPGITLPTYGGAPIRLVDLASHTAGLPRGKIGDTNQSPAQVWAATARMKLSGPPGTNYLYSNLGFGLLGLAEERAENQGYEQLVVQQIAGPLGMPDTRITLSRDQLMREAEGHHPNGSRAALDDPQGKGGILGAYALNSTLDDMMHYLELQLGDAGSDVLKQAAQLTQRPVHPTGPRGQVGLAWNTNRLNDGTPVVNKDGSGPGFTDFVAFTPSTHTGVVVLTNELTCPVSRISFTALYALNHGALARAPVLEPDRSAVNP